MKFYKWVKRRQQLVDDGIYFWAGFTKAECDLVGDILADKDFDRDADSIDAVLASMGFPCQQAVVAAVSLYRQFEGEARHVPKRRRPLGLTLRFSILKRDGYRCRLCGASADTGATLEVDHKVAVSRGGSNDCANLWVLCFDCNRGKHAKSV